MTARTDPGSYRERVARATADGWTYAGLYATQGGRRVRTVLAGPGGATRVESVAAATVPSIVDLVPAAAWDEREAHDLYGVGFTGHEPLRPLVDHGARIDRWSVPVRGPDAYQVAVGPIHAGVIESGHFRFHVVGERILHLDARLFYKHRGLERAAEGAALDDGIAFIGRACAACSVSNAVAYAHACEQALGLIAPPDLARVRTVLLELERVWNHLNDIAAACAGVGLAAGNAWFAGLTERARRLNAALTGHRFLAGSVRLAESKLSLGPEALRACAAELAELRAGATTGWRELAFNASFQDRLPGVGVVTANQAAALGAVGPAARAAGLPQDIRAHSPRLAYPGFAPVVPERAAGDVQARLEQRALELWQSFSLLDSLLDRPIPPVTAEGGTPDQPVGVGVVESPRGRTLCVVERDGERIARVHLRTGAYANWPVVAFAAADNLLPDFPLINKSFELCYACADR